MITFKTREDVLASALILISVIAVVGVLVYCLVFPVPDASTIAESSAAQLRYLNAGISKADESANVSRSAIAARLWNGDDNHVGAAVLALVTTATTEDGVKLTAFRPQRTVDLNGVVELPFLLELTGPYSGVRVLMREMDNSRSKVVMKSVQVSASEEVTGSVTSTVVVSAYVTSDPTITANIAGEGNDSAAAH